MSSGETPFTAWSGQVETAGLAYGGWCAVCAEVHNLPTAPACAAARTLVKVLTQERCLDYAESESTREARLRLEGSHDPRGGKMLGVMVARDADGRQHTLKAFSGQYDGAWMVRGWVPPVVPLDHAGQVVPHQRQVENRLAELGKRVAELGISEKVAAVRLERRELSRQLMGDIHRAYVLRNARGQKRPLADVFVGNRGMPSGVGDCCAPKLLQACYERGLEPEGLLEFWWGRDESGKRIHLSSYGACADKCQPILGFMLCGLA